MKLLKSDGWVHKDKIYEVYCRLVDGTKSFTKITRKAMLEEIIQSYSAGSFLRDLLTEQELEALEILAGGVKNDKMPEILGEYNWEVNQLARKLIIDPCNLRVYEELTEPVAKVLSTFHDQPTRDEEELVILLLGFLRVYVDMPKLALTGILVGQEGVTEATVERLLNLPLFRFYAMKYTRTEMAIGPAEVFVYADYCFDSELYNDIRQRRKKYAVNTGKTKLDPNVFVDMFYYGVPLEQASVEKMYQALGGKHAYAVSYILDCFDKARLTYRKSYLNQALECVEQTDRERFKKLLAEAWEDTPSAALNGLSPREYRQAAKEDKAVRSKFKQVPQKNAHLSEEDADYFYEIYFALLEYVNNERRINPKLKRIYRQLFLDPADLRIVEDFLWSHKKYIDRFVKKNPYDFGDDTLNVVRGFKNAVTGEYMAIVGYDEDYARIYDGNTHRIYMVKGIRGNFDEIMPAERIPVPISVTLLNFKGNIIFNSNFLSHGVDLGTSWRKLLLEEMKGAEVCYEILW